MNLSNQEKKLFFRVGIAITSLIVVAAFYWMAIKWVNDYKHSNIVEHQMIAAKYEAKVDSINIVNTILLSQVDSLEKEIKEVKGTKEIVYIETTKKDNIIKDASAADHAKAIDSLTEQMPTWAIIKDTQNDTLIKYQFTKEGVIKLRLKVNSLYKYKDLYKIDEVIIHKQQLEIDIFKEVSENCKDIVKLNEDAITIYKQSNEKLIQQLNKSQKRAGRWPYWLGGGILGGVILCLSVK